MSTIEERGNELGRRLFRIENQANVSSAIIQEQWYAAVYEALRTERRLVLEQIRDLIDRKLAELGPEPEQPTESIAEAYSNASKERL